MQYVIKSGDGDRVKVEKNHLYSKYDTLTALDTRQNCRRVRAWNHADGSMVTKHKLHPGSHTVVQNVLMDQCDRCHGRCFIPAVTCTGFRLLLQEHV